MWHHHVIDKNWLTSVEARGGSKRSWGYKLYSIKKSRIMNKYSTYGSIYLLFGSIFFVNTVHHNAILKDRYRPNQLRTTKKPSSLNLQLNYTKQAYIFSSSTIQRLSTHNQILKPFLFYTLYLYVHVLLACKIQNWF